MQTRVCVKCGLEYPLTEEHFPLVRPKNRKPYFRNDCWACQKVKAAGSANLPPIRPYTYTTDVLIVQFANEDGCSVAEIARHLARDPEDLKKHIAEAVKRGTFRRLHRAMMAYGGIYALKMRNPARRGGMAEMGTG